MSTLKEKLQVLKTTMDGAVREFEVWLAEESVDALEAEKEPECEFWEGQYVNAGGKDDIRIFSHITHTSVFKYVMKDGTDWQSCRPAQNVAQWRPIPDDLMEMPWWLEEDDTIECTYKSGKVVRASASYFCWSLDGDKDNTRVIAVIKVPKYQEKS